MIKQEWFGEVPNNWDVIRGRFLFRQSTEKGNQNLVLLSATQDKGVVDKNTLEGVVQVSQNADLMQFKTVHKDDFVISLRSFQGGFEYSAIEGVISPAYSVFRLIPSKFPHYFRHLFKSETFISKLNSLTTGIREGKNIQYFDFSNILLPVPPIPTQQQIATFLDEKCADIDQLIALQQQMIDELKAYKQSVITEAVCKGLDKSVPMKDSGIEWIGEVPENWDVCRVKNMISFNPNHYNTNDLKDEDMVSFMPMECLRMGVIEERTINYKEALKYTPFENEDIVIAKVTPCFENKNIAIATNLTYGFGFGTSEIFVIRCNDGLFNQFMLYYLLSNYIFSIGVASMTGTGGLKRISPKALNEAVLLLPSLQEQQAIVKSLNVKCSQIDNLISIKQQKIDELKEYKKSMIYEYITGKKQVPENNIRPLSNCEAVECD